MPTETTLSSPTTSRSSSMLSASNCTSSSILSFACGAAAGAAMGAAIALLYAPMTGSAMRARVRTLADEGSCKLQELVDSGRHLAEDALHQTASAIDAGRRAFRTRVDSYSSPERPSPSAYSNAEPLTARVSELSGTAYPFDEPLGG